MAEIDRGALKTLLVLALHGAASDGAKLGSKTAQTWETLATFASGPAGATIALAGADSFPVPSAAVVSVAQAAELCHAAMVMSGGFAAWVASRPPVTVRGFGWLQG